MLIRIYGYMYSELFEDRNVERLWEALLAFESVVYKYLTLIKSKHPFVLDSLGMCTYFLLCGTCEG